MKHLITCLFFLAIATASNGQSTVKTAPEGYQYFEMAYGDSTIVMRQYFIAFLKRGPERSQSDEEAQQIQAAHLTHLANLYQMGKTSATGPFGDDGDIRGVIVFNTATLEEAQELAAKDPAVKAGRLIIDIHPWWAMKGSVLK